MDWFVFGASAVIAATIDGLIIMNEEKKLKRKKKAKHSEYQIVIQG